MKKIIISFDIGQNLNIHKFKAKITWHNEVKGHAPGQQQLPAQPSFCKCEVKFQPPKKKPLDTWIDCTEHQTKHESQNFRFSPPSHFHLCS